MAKKLNEIELRSEEVHDILTEVPNWMIRWGNLLVLFIIILVLILSWFIKYPDSIEGKAIITTEIPPGKEFAKINGKIDSIFVQNRQTVQAGEPLALIRNTAEFEDVKLLKSIVDTTSMINESFVFPIEYLPKLFLGEIEGHYALFENSYIQYKLDKELQPFDKESIANKQLLSELRTRLNSLKTQQKINRSEFLLKQSEFKRNESLFKKGIISKQEFENKQIDLAQAERSYKDFEQSLSLVREAIGNAKKASIGSEITRVQEETSLLKSVLQSFDQLKNAIIEWEQKYLIKSEISGKVSFLNFWNKGQTINNGDLAFTVIPEDNSSFIAKLKSPIRNSGKIRPGQRVNIKLENYPDSEFGILKGTVKNISLIPDNEGFYLIDVKLPPELITSYGKKLDFRQEMTGNAEIITEDLRLIERFFYQFRKVLKG